MYLELLKRIYLALQVTTEGLSSLILHSHFNVPGFSPEFPRTWDTHGQARPFVYISDDIKYTRKGSPQHHDDLPNITLDIGPGAGPQDNY